MSYIQCKDEQECEAKFTKRGDTPGFVTEDFRIYEKLELWDREVRHPICAQELHALIELRGMIEYLGEDGIEQSMLDLEANAKMLTDSFKKLVETLGLKLEKRKAQA